MKHRVLIIEDEALLRESYATKLSIEGFDVQSASDGNQGLELARSFKPEIILLDLLMPNLNGFDFLKQYRSEPGSTAKVIVFSNMNTEDSAKKIAELGVEKFFIKATTTPARVYEFVVSLFEEEKNSETPSTTGQ